MLLDYRSVEIGVFLVHPSRRRGEAKTRAWADFMKTALRDALWRERRDNPECAAESGDGIREVSFPHTDPANTRRIRCTTPLPNGQRCYKRT
ncbi:hypothetical protein [Burkholderia pseudomultivorans]|uniref:hypothetical protein n=1 Tax=Burkholderia pseudomultivorans TaxID=1207504 RepID=UPI000AC37857|nr:hypothetical protein [Burkholderia pseudomultivorans]